MKIRASDLHTILKYAHEQVKQIESKYYDYETEKLPESLDAMLDLAKFLNSLENVQNDPEILIKEFK